MSNCKYTTSSYVISQRGYRVQYHSKPTNVNVPRTLENQASAGQVGIWVLGPRKSSGV